MNARRMTRILAVAWATGALLCAPGCLVESEQPDVSGTTVHLSVLRTTDIHSRIFPYDFKPNTHDQGDGLYLETSPYGGAERIAALIHRERQRGDRVLYLDSGDMFQGAPIFNHSNGEAEFKWLSMIGVDAMAVGNHEFDKGPQNLATQVNHWVHYPFLNGNYIFDDWTQDSSLKLGRYLQPYTILNAKGLKIGLIGMGDVGSMFSIYQGGNSAGITPVEAKEAVRAYVEFLSPSVDLIVILSHLGLTDDQQLTSGHDIYFTKDKDVSAYTGRKLDPWLPMICEGCTKNERKYWIPGVRGIDLILGGHLHIMTHPAMLLRDPAGRQVLLEHAGAFAKFLTRLDMAVAVPQKGYRCDADTQICLPKDTHFNPGIACASDADCSVAKIAPFGAEILAHQHKVLPIDTIWCTEPRPDPYEYDSMDALGFVKDVDKLSAYCGKKGHAESRNLLEPYRTQMELDPLYDLTQVFGYAPISVERRTSAGADSPLGNITAEAMMVRKRVEAEFCVTNTLGIRDSFYPGVINQEMVFNVFPFENIITVMYLSGVEIQEMFDFVTEKSFLRGCQSQAQIAGISFVMDCGQAKRNQLMHPCGQPEDCCVQRPELCAEGYEGTGKWECREGV